MARARNRSSDRHARHAVVAAIPERRVDQGLGRTVAVIEANPGEGREHARLQLRRQGFTAGKQPLERHAAFHLRLSNEMLEHRRHEMQRRHIVGNDRVNEKPRFAMRARRGDRKACADGKRPQDFPHRDVEAERRFLQQGFAGIEAIFRLHPAEPCGQRAMRASHALWHARRSRRVHDIGESCRIKRDVEIAARLCYPGLILHVDGPGFRRRFSNHGREAF